MKLYSYCIPVDDGAAPNPFWGTCTLAICKPVIRRNAKVGDWIIATGSSKYGLENKVVYTMEVTQILSFQEYDTLCKNDPNLINKIPNWASKKIKRKVGDCIYDFSDNIFFQRKGVHDLGNIERDLKGKNVLLSNNFYYFGAKPHELPKALIPIVRQGQGHKSNANKPYLDSFINWIITLARFKNKVMALPFGFALWNEDDCAQKCSLRHLIEDKEDENIGNCDI